MTLVKSGFASGGGAHRFQSAHFWRSESTKIDRISRFSKFKYRDIGYTAQMTPFSDPRNLHHLGLSRCIVLSTQDVWGRCTSVWVTFTPNTILISHIKLQKMKFRHGPFIFTAHCMLLRLQLIRSQLKTSVSTVLETDGALG